jgi:hypothetical protein
MHRRCTRTIVHAVVATPHPSQQRGATGGACAGGVTRLHTVHGKGTEHTRDQLACSASADVGPHYATSRAADAVGEIVSICLLSGVLAAMYVAVTGMPFLLENKHEVKCWCLAPTRAALRRVC